MSHVANQLKAVKNIRWFISTALLTLLLPAPVMAVQSVVISWNPSSVAGVTGYKIYSGGASQAYTSVIDAGNATNVTISGLADGSTNYFSATTYDSSSNESAHSDEVAFVAPKAITTTTNQVVTVPPPPTPGLHVISGMLLTTNPTDIHSVQLSWTPSSDAGVAGYQILVGQASGNYSMSRNVGLVSSLVFTGLVSGSTYFFAVRSFDGSWNQSDMPVEVSCVIPFPAAPAPTNSIISKVTTPDPTPTNAPATNLPPVLNPVSGLNVATNPADIHSVTLNWTPSVDVGVTGYRVFSGQATGKYSLTQNVALVNSLVFTGLVSGTTNFFTVLEFDGAGNQSALSPEVQQFIPLPVLNPVSGLTVTINPLDARSVLLNWNASSDEGVVGYKFYSGPKTATYTLSRSVGLANSLVVTGLVYGATNFFAVREYNGALKEGGISEVRWIVPAKTNLRPTLNALGNFNLDMNAAKQTVNLAGITSGALNERQTLKITVASSNTGLIPTPTVTYTSPNTTGTLAFKPATGRTGTAVITVTVDDGATGFANRTITRSFTVTVVDPAVLAAMPKFSTQLKGGRVLKNKSVVLGVAMAGKAPFKYQWKFNGTNLVGQTGATLTISAAKLLNAGNYMVQVSNSAGVTNSAVANLTVFTNTAPTVVTPAVSQAGQFSFQVPAEAGLNYVVEATTDFKTWTPVVTNTAPFTFTENNTAGFTQRYYRSRYLP